MINPQQMSNASHARIIKVTYAVEGLRPSAQLLRMFWGCRARDEEVLGPRRQLWQG
jgi:hypothetical protein